MYSSVKRAVNIHSSAFSSAPGQHRSDAQQDRGDQDDVENLAGAGVGLENDVENAPPPAGGGLTEQIGIGLPKLPVGGFARGGLRRCHGAGEG
jgi:hypothetical protein